MAVATGEFTLTILNYSKKLFHITFVHTHTLMNWDLNKLELDGKEVDFYLWFDSQQSKHGKQ